MPVTQGSSRNLRESGSHLYARRLSPWRDPRYVYLNRRARMFVLYKLFSREISFWRDVAKNRAAQDIVCCQCCAAIGEEYICNECDDVLQDPNRYQWLVDCMLGKPPFTFTDLPKEELEERLSRAQNHDLFLMEYIWSSPFAGPTNDDGDRAWNLDFYTPLDRPYQDISELRDQWNDFNKVL